MIFICSQRSDSLTPSPRNFAAACKGFLKFCGLGFLKRKLPTSGSGLTLIILAPFSLARLESGQHPRVIRPRILADDENSVGLQKIVQSDRPFADPDCLFQGGTTRFVAHIRTIREIVRTEHPDKKLVKVGGFVAGASRSIKRRFVRRTEGFNSVASRAKAFSQLIGS